MVSNPYMCFLNKIIKHVYARWPPPIHKILNTTHTNSQGAKRIWIDNNVWVVWMNYCKNKQIIERHMQSTWGLQNGSQDL